MKKIHEGGEDRQHRKGTTLGKGFLKRLDRTGAHKKEKKKERDSKKLFL